MYSEINPKVSSKIAGSLRKKLLKGNKSIKVCCTKTENLLPEEANDANMTAKLRCRVCGRGHIYMFAETGELGCTLHALGNKYENRLNHFFFHKSFDTPYSSEIIIGR